MLGKLLDPHIRRMKHTAADFIAGLDDRSRLLALELGSESRWLAELAGLGLAAIIVIIICFVWLMGSLVLLAWDTPWRLYALGFAAAFWIGLSALLVLRIRKLLQDHPRPFPFTRQVLADDLNTLKSGLNTDGKPQDNRHNDAS